MKFFLIGDGRVAQNHRRSIEHVGGEIITVIDPKNGDQFPQNHFHAWKREFENTDYFVICSPSQYHRSQIKFILKTMDSMCWEQQQIICEKPAFLPWEIPILDDRINIVLQLRYIENLPSKADKIVAHFVRNEDYFKSWKGDPKSTGGLFYNLFIHFIDLSILLDAEFEGSVNSREKQSKQIFVNFIREKIEYIHRIDDPRKKEFESIGKSYRCPIGTNRYNEKSGDYELDLYDESGIIDGNWENVIDLANVDMQSCYNRMYEAILQGNGIKPEDLFYLNWVLQRNSEIFGYGKNGINKSIKIDKELL